MNCYYLQSHEDISYSLDEQFDIAVKDCELQYSIKLSTVLSEKPQIMFCKHILNSEYKDILYSFYEQLFSKLRVTKTLLMNNLESKYLQTLYTALKNIQFIVFFFEVLPQIYIYSLDEQLLS